MTRRGSGTPGQFRQRFQDWMFVLSIAFTLVVPTVVGIWRGDANTAWLAAVCGVFVTLASKIDVIVEFSFGPLRAKMRDAIEEAYATITEVRKIAANISEPMLATLMAGNFGFSDGLNLQARLEQHDGLIANLREIGVTEEEIIKAERKWRGGIGVIYHRAIAPLIDERRKPYEVNHNATPEQKEAYEGWDNLLLFEDWKAPSPSEMEEYLREKGVMTAEMQEWIDDYRNFIETGEIRRREIFVTK